MMGFALAAYPLFANSTPPSVANYTTYGDSADIQGSFVLDSCKSGYAELRVYASAGKGGGQLSSGYAYGYVYGYDACAQLSFGNSFQGNVQFSANDAKGVVVPKSVTSSGQLPSDDGTDAVTFTLIANSVGTAYQERVDDHRTVPFGDVVLVIDDKSDNSSTAGTGSVTLSTQSLGTISLAGVSITLQNFKSHTFSVTR
jgi:hypothetical protein